MKHIYQPVTVRSVLHNTSHSAGAGAAATLDFGLSKVELQGEQEARYVLVLLY